VGLDRGCGRKMLCGAWEWGFFEKKEIGGGTSRKFLWRVTFNPKKPLRDVLDVCFMIKKRNPYAMHRLYGRESLGSRKSQCFRGFKDETTL
jgi:hypothetical protein